MVAMAPSRHHTQPMRSPLKGRSRPLCNAKRHRSRSSSRSRTTGSPLQEKAVTKSTFAFDLLAPNRHRAALRQRVRRSFQHAARRRSSATSRRPGSASSGWQLFRVQERMSLAVGVGRLRCAARCRVAAGGPRTVRDRSTSAPRPVLILSPSDSTGDFSPVPGVTLVVPPRSRGRPGPCHRWLRVSGGCVATCALSRLQCRRTAGGGPDRGGPPQREPRRGLGSIGVGPHLLSR